MKEFQEFWDSYDSIFRLLNFDQNKLRPKKFAMEGKDTVKMPNLMEKVAELEKKKAEEDSVKKQALAIFGMK